jgi:hypothetical protein
MRKRFQVGQANKSTQRSPIVRLDMCLQLRHYNLQCSQSEYNTDRDLGGLSHVGLV